MASFSEPAPPPYWFGHSGERSRRTLASRVALTFCWASLLGRATEAEPRDRPEVREVEVVALSRNNGAAGSVNAQPSCSATEYAGRGGVITVQTSGSGVVAWGINMFNPASSAGKWDIDTFVNGKKTTSGFRRITGVYIPHGAVNAREARSGARFEVRGTLAAADGTTYTAVPNFCIIP